MTSNRNLKVKIGKKVYIKSKKVLIKSKQVFLAQSFSIYKPN